ncbi:hypothetical protein A6R68_21777, partial [Neotoma lepida]
MATVGSKNNMTSQNRSPSFSSKEAQDEGATVEDKDLSQSSPETPQCQTAPRAPFRRRVWKSLRNNIMKGPRSLCYCLCWTEERQRIANNKILAVSLKGHGGSRGS